MENRQDTIGINRKFERLAVGLMNRIDTTPKPRPISALPLDSKKSVSELMQIRTEGGLYNMHE